MKKTIIFLLFVSIVLENFAQNTCDLFSKAMETTNEKSRKELFKGQILKGQRNGMGVLLYPKDSSIYIGDFYRDDISGYGMFIATAGNPVENCENCMVYIGNWKDGKKSGFGTCYASNGDIIYQGQFEKNKPTDNYPSNQLNTTKYFSCINFENKDAYVGEIKNGMPNGYGALVLSNGDVWISSFKDGKRAGVGLYMLNNGEWETLNFENDGTYNVISSSVNYANIDAARKESVRNALSEAFGYFAAAASISMEVAQGVHELKNESEDMTATTEYNGSGTSSGYTSENKNSSKKQSKDYSAPYSLSENQSKNTDSKTYARYDSMLSKMRSGNMEYNDKERREWQSKMKEIRKKWESRGERFQHSANEDWLGPN